MFLPSKNKRKKNNIPAGTGYFLSTSIDSRDFKNENLNYKNKKKQGIKKIFFEKIFRKDLQIDQTIK